MREDTKGWTSKKRSNNQQEEPASQRRAIYLQERGRWVMRVSGDGFGGERESINGCYDLTPRV